MPGILANRTADKSWMVLSAIFCKNQRPHKQTHSKSNLSGNQPLLTQSRKHHAGVVSVL